MKFLSADEIFYFFLKVLFAFRVLLRFCLVVVLLFSPHQIDGHDLLGITSKVAAVDVPGRIPPLHHVCPLVDRRQVGSCWIW